jgi:alpha-glucosidase
MNLDGLHMPFNFAILETPWTAGAIRALVEKVEAVVPVGAWPNYVLGNHDETRIATRLGADQTRIAAMLLLTLRGTPTLYYGDEIGLREADIPPQMQQDPWGRNIPGKGRDGRRTPMQWTDGDGAGFTNPDVEPWLPFSDDMATRNVETLLANSGSLLNLYRQLLALRRQEPALQAGDHVSLEGGGVFSYYRDDGHTRLMVALNFTDETRSVEGMSASDGRLLISTELDRQGPVALALLELRPHEGVIIKLD